MANRSTPLTPKGRLLVGLLFVALGLLPMLAAFDVGPLGCRADRTLAAPFDARIKRKTGTTRLCH